MAEFDIMFNRGISREGDLVDLGVEHGLLRKSGAFYSWEETRLGQGRENAKAYLLSNPAIAFSLENRIREIAELPQLPIPVSLLNPDGREPF